MSENRVERYKGRVPAVSVEAISPPGARWSIWDAIDSVKGKSVDLGRNELDKMLSWLNDPQHKDSKEVALWKKHITYFIDAINDELSYSTITGIEWGSEEDDYSYHERFIAVDTEFPGEWHPTINRFASRR